MDNSTSTGCPPSLANASITGSFGSTVTVVVNVVLGSDPFNAFDIRLKADTGVLNASSVGLTGSVLLVDSTTLKAECINGAGLGCVSPLDGPGIVRVSVNDTGVQFGSSGRLFAVTYRIVGLTTDTPIGFQIGCQNRSGSGVCVTLTHPLTCFEGNCTTIAGEFSIPGVFGNLPVLFRGYMVTVTPVFTFNSVTRELSATIALTVANDTTGAVLFSKTFSISLKANSGGIAGFLLVAPVPPAPLAVGLSVNGITGSANGLVSGNPDVRNQGSVDLIDVATAALFYGAAVGSSGYSLSLDLNRDGVINILDLALMVSYYGEPAFQ